MTQTATNIKQSRKLLELGIDPETADLCYFNSRLYTPFPECKGDIPAWSLAALLENVIPKVITYEFNGIKDLASLTIDALSGGRWCLEYVGTDIRAIGENFFAACIDLIEQLIKQGYIKTKKKEQ